MDQHKIELEHFYPHPVSNVWDAISKQEAISTWFIQADFQAEEGYGYTFTHEQTTITGTVLKASPPSELTYTWVVGGVETTVSWMLSAQENGTLLKLIHTGIEKYGESAAVMFGNFEGGWNNCIAELESYLIPQNV